jgi:(4-O-methyl)-D-glucuronate---lignin esterase
MLGELLSTPLWKAVAFCAAACVLAAAGAHSKPASSELPPVSELPANPELPDPLVMFDGKRVTGKKQWQQERRPELKRLFQHYMYGYAPPPPEKVRATVERENPQLFGGKATLREVTIRFGPPATPPIHLMVVVPNARKKPAPAFLGITFSGNHALVTDPQVRIPDVWMYPNQPGTVNNRAMEAGRGGQVDVWNIEGSIDRGYAVATFYNGDVDPDKPDFTDGVHPHYFKPGQTAPEPHDWGTIAAWAWGMQRAVDYLVTDRDIDAKRIAAVGHSRNGKTALLAAAFDERIALSIPHQAGCGGTAPSRGKIGESVQRINTSFPHWFNDVFPQFNERPELLPFDQHCLAALMAPRPVLFSNAQEDSWANPEGQFQVLQAADPVYRFLGVEGLQAKAMPPLGKLVDSRLGYFIRPGKHSMTREDWEAFWDFADRHFPTKR